MMLLAEDGTELGYPIRTKYKRSTQQAWDGFYAHQVSMSTPNFPEGYIILEEPPTYIYWGDDNCTGQAMTNIVDEEVLYQNILFYKKSHPDLYKRTGNYQGAVGYASRSGRDGTCCVSSSGCSGVLQRAELLEDTGYDYYVKLSFPWTLTHL